MYFLFFFKQKTAYEVRISDWSSDVCSSDLGRQADVQDHQGDRAVIDATVTHTLTAAMLADLMVTAIEGGCGYWASDLELVSGTDEYEPPYYADPRFYLSPFKLALTACMRDVNPIQSHRPEALRVGKRCVT